jgi:hypothetical protein
MYYMIHATDHESAPLLMNRAYLKANERRESEKLLQHSLEELGLILPEQRRPSPAFSTQAYHSAIRRKP